MKRSCLCLLLALMATCSALAQSHSWDKTVHNFGDVSTGDGPLSCAFTLTNNGPEPLLIFEVVSSCGCTDVSWTKESIGPGEKGTVKATYKNTDGALTFDKALTVYLTGSKKPDILHIRGVVHAEKKSLQELYGKESIGPLGLKSRSVSAGNLKQGQYLSGSIPAANLGKKALKISFTDVSPQLTLSVEPIPRDATAEISYTIKADASLYGKQVYKATPVINGKKAAKPIEITAWTQENFLTWSEEARKNAALPYFGQSTVSVGSLKAGEKTEVTFTCTNRGKSPLVFYKVDADNPAAAAPSLPEIPAGKKATLSFTLDTAGLPAGDLVVMLSLTTNAPLRPLVNLFITGIILE